MEDHHAEVDEIVTTSQEIVSLCSDLYNASAVTQLASDLSEQFETRKQTVRRRLDDLEAFFRQIFTDVNTSSYYNTYFTFCGLLCGSLMFK